ncbi:hypothetical protein OD350_03580 [Clostridium beijerinckii]|uniref:hypothetical protein n=1 Tax=Clostridium beijerinckii TaxID=1520 RepID=UPI0022272BAF|nr:hypothetical protein [Clostridium beijerinckii]UYZ36764.1 hypothetical protein OD350_03580 [Clostridium beijerinckii]
MQRLIPQEVKNKVYEVTQQVLDENGNVEINEVQAVLERDHGICFFNMAELEKLIREGLEKQIFVYKNGTAPEASVQEQSQINFSPQTGEKLHEICPNCWVKNKPYKCGFDKCPGYKLLVIEATTEEK